MRANGVPQGLKPHCYCSGFGTAEAVPLNKTGRIFPQPVKS